MFTRVFNGNAHASAWGKDDQARLTRSMELSTGLLELLDNGAWHVGSLGLHAWRH